MLIRLSKMFFLGLLLLNTEQVGACDICGCASSAFGMGWLPGQPQHFIGLQWSQRSYQSTHRTLFADEIPIRTRERITEMDVVGRWSFHPRWQVLGKWGYREASSTGDVLPLRTSAWVDPSVVAMRIFGPVDDTLCRRLTHHLILGAGVEMPLAPSRLRDANNAVMPTLLQPGSGSWDPLMRIIYTANATRFGWMIEGQTMLSTYRKNGDRRGHQMSWSARYHRRLRWRSDLVVMPHVSPVYDLVGREWVDNNYNDDSGGWAAYVRAGLDITYRSWALRSYVQTPIAHDIADGLVEPNAPIHFSILYILQNNKKK
jgi:hypothetical protein